MRTERQKINELYFSLFPLLSTMLKICALALTTMKSILKHKIKTNTF